MNDGDVSVSGFGNVGDASFDPGYSLGAAAGLAFNVVDSIDTVPQRVELECSYQQVDIDTMVSGSVDADLSMMALMLNYYVDLENESIITPYVMAGIGAANVEIDDDSQNDDDTVFAFNLGGGLAWAIGKNLSLDTEYRYFVTGDPKFEADGDKAKIEISGSRVQVGLRYTFN